MIVELWQRIRLARKHAGLSQEKLGAVCDPPVSKAAVGMWESPNPSTRTQPKLHNVMRIARATGVSVEWLLGEPEAEAPEWLDESVLSLIDHFPPVQGAARAQPPRPSDDQVPLISWVQAGEWAQAIDTFAPGDAEDWIACPARHGRHAYALRVKGDSMTAPYGKSYPDGCIIFVDPDKVGGVTTGDRVIAKLQGHDEVTLKVYVEDAGRRFLKALNPSYPPITDPFRILGKVIGKYEED